MSVRHCSFAVSVFLMMGESACQPLAATLASQAPSIFAPTNLADYKALHPEQPRQGGFGLVDGYRHLNGVLYSRCRNLPSDSTFLHAMLPKTGSDRGSCTLPILYAVSRLIREHDLPMIHPHRPIEEGSHLRWYTFPAACAPP